MMSGTAGRVLERAENAIYAWQMGLWTAWARRRHRRDFDDVEAFCLFAGYARSGHSIVGAMLNAHRYAVVAHELVIPPLIARGISRDELYARIIARAWWFNMRGNEANYPYQIPGQWQGRFETLRIIGDKRGGAVSRAILADPGFLQRVRDITGVPLRVVHVARNPFDNIAAISLGHRLSLRDSVDFYFRHAGATVRLPQLCAADELFVMRHEAMLEDPARSLEDLCRFLGLELYPGYVDACRSVLFPRPTYSRRKVEWSRELIAEVEARASEVALLDGYRFEIGDEPSA